MASQPTSSIPLPAKMGIPQPSRFRSMTTSERTVTGADQTGGSSNQTRMRVPEGPSMIPSKLATPSRSLSFRQNSRTAQPASGLTNQSQTDAASTRRPRPISLYAPKTTSTLQKQPSTPVEPVSKTRVGEISSAALESRSDQGQPDAAPTRRPRPISLYAPKTASNLAKQPSTPVDPVQKSRAGEVGTASLESRTSLAQHSRSRSVTTVGSSTTSKLQSSTSRMQVPSKLKPNFSTYQQHFSPRKPQPPGVVQVVESTISASETDFSDLQDELLQLLLLVNEGQQNLGQARTSAAQQLDHKRRSLKPSIDDLRSQEAQLATDLNRWELAKWLNATVGRNKMTVQEKLVSLVECIQVLTELSSTGGMVSRILNDFQAWQQQARGAMDTRSPPFSTSLNFIQPIPVQWHEDLLISKRRLTECKDKLGLLRDANNVSSVGRVINSHYSYASILLTELLSAEQLEASILQAERQTIESQIANLLEQQMIVNTNSFSPQGLWETLHQ